MVALRIRLLAVTRFRLLGCTSVTFQATSPFLFAAPFNMSKWLAVASSWGYYCSPSPFISRCKDNALLHKLYAFKLNFMVI